MTPYYQHGGITIYYGDCREVAWNLPKVSAIVADPPYQQTSLEWDRWPNEWPTSMIDLADSMWVFGTMRMFLLYGEQLRRWQFSQDMVWEKQNGSSFHADRFRRVHESIAHFYRGPWEKVYKNPVMTLDATARVTRRKTRPNHMGKIAESAYVSHDGGPRLMRSVVYEPNCHGFAENETQKPLGILRPLLEYACPKAGIVLDPFCGSGSTLVAAKQLGMSAIGIELREEQCEIAARRLQQEVMSFEEVSHAS